MSALFLFSLLLACKDEEVAPPSPEPLDLPEDPAARGVPVGVTTVRTEDLTLEIFYPASDATADLPGDPLDYDEFLPDSFVEAVGDVHFPTVDAGVVRDADLRVPEAAYPVILFSHGFGGMRTQSPDYAAHLASRGYVVIAPDHPGRMMGDVLPCMFSPPLDGCDLGGFFGDDPAEDDLPEALAWAEQANGSGTFAAALDLERVGLSGHSAGGGSTATVGQSDDRYDALLIMAAGGAVTRDVPVALMGGTCDGVVPYSGTEESLPDLSQGALVEVLGAGHLAFSDLCSLDLVGLASEWLEGRDDLNETLYSQLLLLAGDGCPAQAPIIDDETCADGFADLDASAEVVRYTSTVFFDAALRGEGEGLVEMPYAEATLTLGE